MPAIVLAIATILIAAAIAVGWVLRAYGGAAPSREVPARDVPTTGSPGDW
jgi:hypothetical protein